MLLPLTKEQRRKQVLTALDLVGLRDRMDHRPGMLSGGQQQRVGIARAMVTDPALIVADEPTGDLDTKSADEVLNIMQVLCTQLNKTIIMVTHDPHAAERATRVLHLEKGKLVLDDTRTAELGQRQGAACRSHKSRQRVDGSLGRSWQLVASGPQAELGYGRRGGD